MSEEKKLTASIMVKDESVDNIFKSEIYMFLKEHGFVLWRLKDYPVCNWIYISLTDKTYMPGIPGIPVTQALGNHAITINEFYEIFRIFEKYDGSSILNMSSQKPSTPEHKPALTVADDKKRFPWETVPIIATIDLVSQTMDISIDVFDNAEIEEDGNKLFQYRFIAEDEVSMQCIDLDLTDTLSEFGINDLCRAFSDGTLEGSDPVVYSWGHIEFMFLESNKNSSMQILAYFDYNPYKDTCDNAVNHNYICLVLNKDEVEKFKRFIFELKFKNDGRNKQI